MDKEYKNSLSDSEEMLQIEALEGFLIISVFDQVFDQELNEWQWLLTRSSQKFLVYINVLEWWIFMEKNSCKPLGVIPKRCNSS